MRRVFALMVVLAMSVLVVLQSTAVAQTGGADASLEQAILKLEKTWLQATQDGKPENAAPLFAEDAVFTDADGTTQGKAGELNEMNKVKWESAEDTDMKVIPHGNTVIVTGDFQGKGKDDRGKKVEVIERWTDVWMNTAHNGWQVVASQSSPVKK
jgi:ketosteroid isomerase-like protein